MKLKFIGGWLRMKGPGFEMKGLVLRV